MSLTCPCGIPVAFFFSIPHNIVYCQLIPFLFQLLGIFYFQKLKSYSLIHFFAL